MIKLVVGLGNPGRQYEKTRHNAGFLFVEYLAGLAGVGWSSSGQFSGEVAECNIGGCKLILLKPMTFMNKSGMSVGKLLRYYKLIPGEMLVVHDDLELSEGVVRLKRDGGHGGHNGLRDIIAHIDSRDFYRLRLGIGRPVTREKVADYVLSGLSLDGQARLLGMFEGVTKNMEALIAGDFALINA
ncbi:aminoacyl-tRNA hydrolase [Methylomonas sp. MO1]|uniref:aminoacyl-tRNA hydrolase n=1 Tax=Methylomonas sp. MO1 TaxID=3073619 RepID=UPI0028A36399|nr:aminoacyl-tRNA hydrolase [Methylomonas sp. MO1]MDT4288801.1 aminoacyl-tRNA hydrolase [Methylomonas sp. MO1]